MNTDIIRDVIITYENRTGNKGSANAALKALEGLQDSHKILEGELAYQEETVLPKLRGRNRDLESAAKSAVGVMEDAVDQGDQGAKEWLRKWKEIIYKELE